MRFRAFAFAMLLVLAAGPASAASADFLGVWTAATPDAGGLARLVIAPGTGGRLDIHVYGRCQPRACDWGLHPARLYSVGPDSTEIASIAAEFDTGTAHKRLTLRPSVGRALRAEVQTDFPDASGRGNYATSTPLEFSGAWNEAPQVAEPPPAAVAAAAPVETPPPPTKPSDDSWFGNSGFIGIGPRLPAGYEPPSGEDCTPFNPAQVRASNTDGTWRLGDFSHRLANFGPRHEDALRALAVLNFYHFDEECFVTREAPTMLYWKRAGLVPKESAHGEVCIGLDPAAAKAAKNEGGWSVMSGMAALLDFGDDEQAAERAASVIRTYRLNRQCFAGPPKSGLQYWLSQ
ncbi:MAG: hypothetical protein WDM86_10420 [Rhizomicrobium sp.]